jgi:putative ABC transport system permease protein
MIVALAASAAVILFSVGLVARQRVKEIGILKAVGASGWHVTGQFAVETAVLSVSAAIIGALATFPLAQTVANSLVSDPSTPGFGGGGGPGGGGGGGGGRAAFAAARAGGGFLGANNILGNVSVAVSADVFLYALGIAIGLALIAAIVPAWFVGRVKPAEVLRHE